MLTLGIETSCDETSVCLLEDAAIIRVNYIASQIDAHQLFGGVVPEVASRKHLEVLNPLLAKLKQEQGIEWTDIDLVAVTHGPGLVGALLVGIAAAKALSYAASVPCQPVNHIEGHIMSTFLADPDLELPMLCLVVSGGHTELVLMRGIGDFERLGKTRDDAVGEAYDKVARALGLPLPGGPMLEKAAVGGDPRAFRFTASNLEPSLDFSYSGLKTAAAQAMAKHPDRVPDIAASFQTAAVTQLARNVERALRAYPVATLGLCGGVAANGALREALRAIAEGADVAFVVPDKLLGTDNAAMIAAAGRYRHVGSARGPFRLDMLDFEAHSVLPVAP